LNPSQFLTVFKLKKEVASTHNLEKHEQFLHKSFQSIPQLIIKQFVIDLRDLKPLRRLSGNCRGKEWNENHIPLSVACGEWVFLPRLKKQLL